MANGQVTTGFSKPVVALYTNNDGTVTYSDCMVLARGVEMSIEPSNSDASNFYCDNIVGEAIGGTFTGGELTLTVDGLLRAAAKFIYGLPDADDDGWVNYGNDADAPYCGFGCIIRTMSGGTTYYTPVVLTKVQFAPNGTEAATQEDEIDWQTQELTATIMRDDTTSQNWKAIGEAQTTEDAAYTLLTNKLGGLVSA